MRLIAVPLARIRPGAPPVTTFLAQSTKSIARASEPGKANTTTTTTTTTTTSASNASAVEKGKRPEKNSISNEKEEKPPPLTTRLLNKASDFWIGLGREDQKSIFDWKRRTYNAGEKLMDRIEYEEWALKGVDPTLGPTLNHPQEKVAKKRAEAKQNQAASQDVKDIITKTGLSPIAALNVPLLFPSSLLNASGLLSSLTRLTASRQPHHRQRLIWCIVGMPLTIPFILIPVVPNLPFFYLVWRAWSHWRAYQSSKYLSELIKQGRLVPTSSKELDRIIAKEAASPPPLKIESPKSLNNKEMTTTVDYKQYLLLNAEKVKDLVKTFNLDHQLSIDLTRARQQTIKSIQRGQMGKLEEAAAGTSTKEGSN